MTQIPALPGSRLQTVAELLPACDTFYDIGTDHGKLGAYLLASGKCQNATLSDINEKPLNRARRLFERMGLPGTFVRTDGLSGLSPTPYDALAICGIGAHVILDILESPLPCPGVLQPSIRVELLRKGLPDRGVRIENERLAREGGRFYVCLSVAPGAAAQIDDRAAYLGALRGDPLYRDYLAWKRSVFLKALSGGSPDAALRERLVFIEEELCSLP